jgi:hypothetical protein
MALGTVYKPRRIITLFSVNLGRGKLAAAAGGWRYFAA